MGVKPATFQSGGLLSQHYLSGAFSRLDFIKGTGGLVSAANAVIFGDCRGGKPNEIHWFSGPTEAENVLRDGPLLDAIRHAFRPGGGLVPQMIGGWRVNPGTRAAREFVETATNMIDALAWDYGLHSNQLKSKLEAASVSGKKLTIQFQENDAEVTDNIEKESFEIQYTGAGSASTMNITKTQLDTTCTGAATDDLVMLFSAFPTINDIVNYINDQPNYTCTIKTSIPTDPSSELDSVSAQDIKTSAYTANSDLQAIIDVLNASPWIDEATFDDTAGTRGIPDNDTAWVYFSGAIDGAYTSTEWGASLTLAEQENIQIVGSSVEDAAIHALIKAHCAAMCGVTGKSERQFILGGAAGETPAQAITRAGNLASEYGLLAFPGFKHYDFNDVTQTKTWSPAYYAAKLLGANVALALNEPATFKDVDVLGWEDVLTTIEAEQLIQGGVCPGIKHKTGRLLTGRTVTTYQGSDLQRCEFSMMREALFMARDMRIAVEDSFVGKAMSNNLLGKIDAIAYGKLSAYFEMGLVMGEPPYWGYKKEIVGDQVKIEYDCNLTPPTNFIFITGHYHVYVFAKVA
jgi:hypothetical protein